MRYAVWLLLFPTLLLAQRPNWVLTFADEFNDAELDLMKWSPHEPGGSSTQTAAGIELSAGQLHLKNGIIATFGTFAQAYGRFEIRCRVSGSRESKAAFRLLPVPLARLPRIDVFESAGSGPDKFIFGNHWGDEQTERSFDDSFAGPDLSAGFHTVAVEWERDRLAWFIDGKERFRSPEGVPQQAMYLLIQMNGGTVDIDYVRVYRRA